MPLLTRELHSHYCNLCESEWDHKDQCEAGPVVSCPWCFPVEDAPPAPGARRASHFHFCSECEQNWVHKAACSAPLRAALPDCTACAEKRDDLLRIRGRRARGISAPSTSRVARPPRYVTRKLVLPASIAAGLIIAIPILLKAPLPFSNPTQQSSAPVPHPHIAAIAPGVPERLAQEAATLAAQAQLQRDGERLVLAPPRPPARIAAPAPAMPEARTAPPRESPAAPKLAASPIVPPPAAVQETRVAPAPPPSAPREPVVETVPRAPETPPRPVETPRQSETLTASGPGASEPPVPGATVRRGAALDTVHGSRRFAQASPPSDDLSWSTGSPRWDRAVISGLLRAVVEIRPPQRLDGETRSIQGFIVDELGHVLTSDRYLRGAASLEVALADGRTVTAQVVARDRLNDVAVLRIARRGLPAIRLGESAALAVGERVLAIRNGGGDRTPAAARVLATGAGTGGNLTVDLTPKADGLGGPLLNHGGEVVGILTESALSAGAPQRLTFAVPVDRVKSMLRTVQSRPPDLTSSVER